MKKKLVIVISIFAVIALGYFFLPKIDSGIEDPVLIKLSEKASNGDGLATIALFYYYKTSGAADLAQYWLLKGALIGEYRLQVEYAKLFSSLSVDERNRILAEVNKSQAPGASCLIRALEGEAEALDHCKPAIPSSS
ncbi:hypothetical protein ACUHMQ_12930 [Chitinimonas sp. PSY-7]|uniref:hypothetical protein n=1 Tax=Chitinimonas sp. PSY-7 TaxID=3459088 RepID=UPI0040402461